MYVEDQFSKSASQNGSFIKENMPGEFYINHYPISIYVQRTVFEPNPRQQGLKHHLFNPLWDVAGKVFEPTPRQQGLKPLEGPKTGGLCVQVFEPNPRQQGLKPSVAI